MSPAWAWLILFIEINVSWIGYDLWAKLTGRKTLSWQMHEWITSHAIGPWIIAFGAFIVVLAAMHFGPEYGRQP